MTAEQILKAWLDANGFLEFWRDRVSGEIIGVIGKPQVVPFRPTFIERLCMCFQITGEIG